jgi:pimeloyl-ACP methyl ester carboxylesterase
MAGQTVRAGQLRVETFGGPGDPALLLIGGAGAADGWWDDEFCARLAAGLRFVVRYDRHESGAAAADPAGRPGGDLDDLVADAVAVLDELAIDRAQLVGLATGRVVATRMALERPGRVAGLTLIAVGPAVRGESVEYIVDDRWRPAGVGVPTLVVHDGRHPLSQDPPIQDSPARPGGQPQAALWDVLGPALLRHTSGGWDAHGDRLALRSLAQGNPTGWFDELYRAGTGGEVPMPWNRTEPHPLLRSWVRHRGLDRPGGPDHPRRAMVVGCGLGVDAEFVGSLGPDTTGFDVSETAVSMARVRHPGSPVHYRTADLLDPPTAWRQAFDLVVEIFTVQALPRSVRAAAIANVGGFVAPGGRLLVISGVHDDADPPDTPPWPLTRAEIESFATGGLRPILVDKPAASKSPGDYRWLAEFHRP